ncbi:uncharacterized protein [Amphiura filiformis]|uniref:uncharacterized protein n=1 Tax=Amphiura filiformis TaxID=82378 RepID=UPI003B210B40
MASKLLFALMAFSLFVAVTVATTFLEEGDDDGGFQFDVMDFLLANKRGGMAELEGEAFEELMDKRAGKGKGKGKGKNKWQLCPPPASNCVCNAKYAPNDKRFFSSC